MGDALNRVSYGKERIAIEKNGRRAAALVPVEDLELLRRLEDHLYFEAADPRARWTDAPSWCMLASVWSS